MLRSPRSWSAALLLLVLPAVSLTAWADDGAEPAFRTEKLADRVYLMQPAEGSGRTNSVVVEREDGLLVIEAQPDRLAAAELLAAIAELSELPVRYLVLSHPHAESSGGAGAFPESTVVIATEDFLETMRDPEFDFAAEMREKGDDGYAPPPRPTPAVAISGNTWLTDAHVPVHLVPLRHTHSPGGMFVRLPEQGVIYAGSLLFNDRNPYAGDASIGGWIAALNNIARLAPERVIPLRGSAVDVLAVRRQREAFAWARGQVEVSFRDGIGVDEVASHVLQLEGIEQYFAVDAEPAFVRGVLDQIVAETVRELKKRGRL